MDRKSSVAASAAGLLTGGGAVSSPPVGPDYDAADVLVVRAPEQLKALADELRSKIVVLLRERARSTTELADRLGLPKGTVAHHVKVLEKAGLITKTKDAQWRPCKLNGEALKGAADWMEQYRVFWEESFDRLDAYLKTVTSKRKGKKHGRKDKE